VVARVDNFEVMALPVTVREFLDFLEMGGYGKSELWGDDWEWCEKEKMAHPASWVRDGDSFTYRYVFGEVPIKDVYDLPVFVSLAEASAYARWKGQRLPTEAEWHRMAFSGPENSAESPFPWGTERPTPGVHGNFGLENYFPTGVGRFPKGASRWGVHELYGQGWELTSTEFKPFEGFAADPRYPEYSADFFDGKHFVLKGASWATHESLIRRSFRNWYQSHYPFVFAKFRLVR